MSNLKENIYDISDLRIGQLSDNYVIKQDDSVKYFSNKIKLIVEVMLIKSRNMDDTINYTEYYSECLTGEDLFNRTAKQPFEDIPPLFASLEKINSKFLTDEEIKTGKIGTLRIFQVFQDINFENFEKGTEKRKVKKK